MTKEDKIKRYFARHPRKVKKIVRIYNQLCAPCRALCMSRPGRAMDDYCDDCQEMMGKVWK